MLKASESNVRWEGDVEDLPTRTLTQVQVQECLATDCCFESSPINISNSLHRAEMMMGHKSLKAILIATLVHLSAAELFTVDPDEFTQTARGTMCNAQHGICNILCSDKVNVNICDSTTLQYDCKCASNNSAPGLEYYAGSVPSYMCTRNYTLCYEASQDNSTAEENCQTSIMDKCGTLDRMKFTAASTVSLPTRFSTADPKPTSGSTTSSPVSTTPGSSTPAPTSSTAGSLPETAQPSSPPSSSSGLSTGAKAGIGAGCAIVGLLLLGAVVYYFYRAGKKAGSRNEKDVNESAIVSPGDKDKSDSAIVGPELEDTQRLEIGGREIPGELDAGAPGRTEMQAVSVPVEIGMSEREESEVRRVVGNK
ncbi:hypothetical protein V500_04352 [Pseudogymnoascus sp. VKM F-4518 (FW-2643)]|nr:hypothetical protein V500_04352 [Pseudogymnoascus sp. VKM F-4518 (FW-2643)]